MSTRENLIYCIDVFRSNSERALNILADTILSPTFPEEELEESRMVVEFQQEELPSQVFSRELVQQAAYKGYPLGARHFCLK